MALIHLEFCLPNKNQMALIHLEFCQISSNACKKLIEFISYFCCIENVSFFDSDFIWKS